MPKFASDLVKHVQPYTRSIGAPWSPLLPSRSWPEEHAAEALAVSDNITDWDPYNGLDVAAPFTDPRGWTHTARHAPWITPLGMWNVAGVNGEGSGEVWPVVPHPEMAVTHAFGFPKPFQPPWGINPGPGVIPNLVSVPPPMPFLGAPL